MEDRVLLAGMTNLSLSSGVVSENVAIGTPVGQFSTTDKYYTINFSLVAGAGSADNASFSIDTQGKLLTAENIDFENQSRYSIRVRSTNQIGQYFEKTFTVSVADENDRPQNIALSKASLFDGQPAGTTVGRFTTSDVDPAQAFVYRLVGGIGGTDNSSFTIDAGGNLKTARVLNLADKERYSIRVRSTDQDGLSVEKSFTVLLTSRVVPKVSVALGKDSGKSGSDRITNTASLQGTISDTIGNASLEIAFGQGTPTTFRTLSSSIGNGGFSITTDQLRVSNGGSLPDGSYSAIVRVRGNGGVVSSNARLTFTLDTSAPVISAIELSASSDTGTDGDLRTDAAAVTLVGATEPGTVVTLVTGGATTIAGANGRFFIPDVDLAAGSNSLRVQAIDLAGNIRQRVQSFVRTVTSQTTDPVLTWNGHALEAIRLDATAPPMATRALAMMHAAILDVVNSIDGTPGRFVTLSAPAGTSAEAAVAAAAHRILSHLYPAQAVTFNNALAAALSSVPAGSTKTTGMTLGRAIADTIIRLRESDGYDAFETFNSSAGPGKWQSTAPFYAEPLLPQWGDLQPFVIDNAAAFLPSGPPALSSAKWATNLNEVKSLGSASSRTRTADQTQIARFWADGAGTYTPPGHWNQIAEDVVRSRRLSLSENARLFAQLNTGLADAAIVAWKAKYTSDFWRPITAIQSADTDGNSQTTKDANWTPLLITPAFPEYVSGHSTFSGTAAQILTRLLGDKVVFSTDSPGLPGVTRSFASFNAAAAEAGRSRIYGGIHYEFSNQDGLATGRRIADAVIKAFATSQDTQAPAILLNPVPAVIKNNVTLTGQILDNLSGIKTATVQIDGAAARVLTLDSLGRFSLPTAFTTNGTHTLRFRTTDVAGNVSTKDASVIFDSLAPTLSITNPLLNAKLDVTSRLIGTASGTGSAINRLTYQFDNGAVIPVTIGSDGDFDADLQISRLSVGKHALKVTVQDAAGNVATKSIGVEAAALAPFVITGITPDSGASNVGVTFRPQVHFSRPIATGTLNQNNFYATDSAGRKLPARIVPSKDGSSAWLFFTDPLPGASTITLHVDGTTIRAASGATLLDADGNQTPGGVFLSRFTTVSVTPIAGTKLSGRVLDPGPDLKPMTFDDIRAGADGVLHTADDSFLKPIAHAKVFILGMENQFVYTDANGFFQFNAAPSGNVKLAIDGRTATNAPAGFFFPEMVMDLELEVGRSNTVMGTMGTRQQRIANRDRQEVYLPRIRSSAMTTISSTAPTVVTVSAESAASLTPNERAQLALTVQPGTAVDKNGNLITAPQIGISTVPPELVRDMLPPGLLQHTFDITIQAPGVSAFTTPLTMTFPNVFNAAPGAKLNFLSFDHTTGRLVIEGTATVSADGKTAVTDEGNGISKPGWHGLTPPGARSGGRGTSGKSGRRRQPAPTTPSPVIPLQLDHRFISDQEGGQRRTAYVPKKNGQVIGKSGVTVGTGVDLGQQKLSSLAIDEALRRKLTPYEGLKTTRADEFLKRNPLILSKEEADQLDQAAKKPILDKLVRSYNRESTLRFEQLPPDAQTAIADIAYQYGNLSSETPNYWKQITTQDWQSAVSNLNDFGDDFAGRRQREAVLIQKVIELERLRPPTNGGRDGGTIVRPDSTNTQTNKTAQSQSNGRSLVQDRDKGVEFVPVAGLHYFLVLDLEKNSILTRGRSDDDVAVSNEMFTANDTEFRVFVFRPSSNEIGYVDFISASSGDTSYIGQVLLSPDFGWDSDADGVSNLAEFIVGSSAELADTNRDGMTDAVALNQGLDPVNDVRSIVGVTENVLLNGEAHELDVVHVEREGIENILVASGSFGLAIVQRDGGSRPTVVSQLDLLGASVDVSVDPATGVAVLAASEGGLHFVNVDDVLSPVLDRTVAGEFRQIECYNGVAFATMGSHVKSFDVISGELLQSLDLSATLVGLTRDRDVLYATDVFGVLHTVDVSNGTMVLRDSLFMTDGAGDLSVGNGVAYIAAALGLGGGIAVANVSDPRNITAISGPDVINVASNGIAANGSGLAVTVGNLGALGPALQIWDVSDPANTGRFVTQFSLLSEPESVAVLSGSAVVANGLGGLTFINYLPFDNAGNAPIVTVKSFAEDVLPNAPGLQVVEGKSISINPSFTDDVQVRNAELIVDGVVVSNDVSFPFEFSAIAPNIPAGQTKRTMSIQVRATDTGGNSATSTAIQIQIIPDVTAPVLLSSNVTNGSKQGRNFRTVVLAFSEAIDRDTLTAESVKLIGSSGTLAPIDIQFRNRDRTVQLTYNTLSVGNYRVVLNRASILDRAGNKLGTGSQTTTFSVVSATAIFANANGGDWNDSGNWTGGVLPGPEDDVLIDSSRGSEILFSAGESTIRSLASSARLTIKGGTLTVTGTVQVNNTLTLNGGVLKGATVQVPASLPPVTWGPGKLGNAAGFADSRLTLPNSLVESRTTETIETWFRTTKDGVIFGMQDVAADASPSSWIPVLYVGTDGRLRGKFWNDRSVVGPITTSGIVNNGQWHHVAIVARDTAQDLYLDGTLVGTLEGQINQAGAVFNQIGTGFTASWPAGNDGWFDFEGDIDDFRVWSTARTSSQIAGNRNRELAGTEAGLLGYWRFNETSGITAKDDASNLTSAPVAWRPGKLGNAAGLLNAHIPLPNSLVEARTTETIETWFRTTKSGVILGMQDVAADASPSSYIPVLYVGTDGRLRGKFWNDRSVVGPITTSGIVNNGQWHHVAIVARDTAQDLYLDGTLVGTLEGQINQAGAVFNQIGTGFTASWPAGNDGWFDFEGDIDDFRVWSTARTSSQIAGNRNRELAGTEAGLLGYWKFNETTGVFAKDEVARSSQPLQGPPPFRMLSGVLDGVTVNGTLDLSAQDSSLTVRNGLVVNGSMLLGSADGSTSGSVVFENDASGGSQTLSGNANVVFGSNQFGFNGFESRSGTLTLAAGVTVHGHKGTLSGAFVNKGTISADVSGGAITVGAFGSLQNQGTVEAKNGGTLSVEGPWSNTGTLRVLANSTLNLGGEFSTAGIGTVSRTNGTVNLTGVLNNSGRTLTFNTATGSWNLNGTVRGGTVAVSGTGKLIPVSGVLDGVTVNGTLDLSAQDSNLTVRNGLVMNGSMLLGSADGSTYGSVVFESDGSGGSQTLSGTANVILGANRHSFNGLSSSNGTLTLAAGVTIHGHTGTLSGAFINKGTISADVSGGTIRVGWFGSLQNQGTVEAKNGGTLSIEGPWSNTGTLRVLANSTLNLGGEFSTAGMGTVSRTNGTVNLTGVLNNSGRTLTFNTATGSWNLNGTVRGGTVAVSGTGKLIPVSGVLDGVTVNGTLDLSAQDSNLTVRNGLVMNGSMLLGSADGSTYGSVVFESDGSGGSQTLSGTANVILGANRHSFNGLSSSNGTLTLAAGVTIHGHTGTLSGAFINKGTISADVSGGTIRVGWFGSLQNQGTVEAKNGGTLSIEGPWSNTGTLRVLANSTLNLGGEFSTAGMGTVSRTNGTVNLTGVLNNSGRTLTFNTATGSWNLIGTVRGGTVAVSGTGKLLPIGGVLDGVTVNGTLDLSTQDSNLTVRNGLVMNGSMLLGSADGSTYGGVVFENDASGGSQTLSGNANVVFGSNQFGFNGFESRSGTLTLAAGVTVHGHTGTLTGAFINNGTISADVAGGTITVGSFGSLQNRGTVEAKNGGTLSISGFAANAGTVAARVGGLISVGGDFANSASGTVLIEIAGPDSNQMGQLSVSGTAAFAGKLTLSLKNGYTPTAGKRFRLIGYSSRTGAFSTVLGTAIPNGLVFTIDLQPDNLSVVST